MIPNFLYYLVLRIYLSTLNFLKNVYGYLHKSLWNWFMVFSWRFVVFDEIFFGKLLSFFISNLSVCEIFFISHQNKLNIIAWITLGFGEPLRSILETFSASQIENQQTSYSSSEISPGDRSKVFLTSCIPDLQLDIFTLYFHYFWAEFDSNSWVNKRFELMLDKLSHQAGLSHVCISY